MLQPLHLDRTYTAFFLFCGLGGAALGTQQAAADFRGVRGRFDVLGGIDNDSAACQDFETLTGVKAACLDLFDREQYTQWHNGKEPPADWQEVTPAQIRAAAQDQDPDVVVVTAPCKGFSGLLSQEKSDSQRYQALNKLTFRGVFLTLEAWKHNLPGIILFENVPRIATRGKRFLSEIKRLLAAYGYLVDDRQHDCGEVGGLGQHRRRYLLIARQQDQLISPVRNTPKRRVKSIGEVIGPLPMPGDPALGPMHRLPRLEWKTWVRLALIPPGGDWRDLQGVKAGEYLIQPHMGENTHAAKYQVLRMDQPAPTVTGSRMGSGAPAIADNRHEFYGNMLHVTAWQEPSQTVTGAAGPNQAAGLVADPRLDCSPRSGTMGVMAWDEPATTVAGSADVHASAAAVADPRIPADGERGVWVIESQWHCWHRPLTTLELLALQGFPTTMPDGSALVLAGKSDRAHRERIGNALPPPTMQAIMEQVLLSFLPSEEGIWRPDVMQTGTWVRPPQEQPAV